MLEESLPETQSKINIEVLNQISEVKNMMRILQIIQKIIESILFFFAGFLFNISFSRKLDFISSIVLFVGALAIVGYIFVHAIKEESGDTK